jgi:hypothetical protein
MITLLPNERLICQSTDGNVNLTTHRILYEYKRWGNFYNQSILLEDITACENKDTPHTWIVALGILFIISAFVATPRTLWIIIGIICLGIYWNAKKNVVIISCPTTKVKISVDGMRHEKIVDLIDKIEQAKHERLINKNNCVA